MLRILSVWRIRQMDLCSRVFIHAACFALLNINPLGSEQLQIMPDGWLCKPLRPEQADLDMMYRDYRS